MTSMVMMGRRIKSSAIFMANPQLPDALLLHLHLDAGNESKLAVGHHRLLRAIRLRDNGIRADGARHLHRPLFGAESEVTTKTKSPDWPV